MRIIGLFGYLQEPGTAVATFKEKASNSFGQNRSSVTFDFIQCSGDSEKLKELVENDPEYQHLAEDAVKNPLKK